MGCVLTNGGGEGGVLSSAHGRSMFQLVDKLTVVIANGL